MRIPRRVAGTLHPLSGAEIRIGRRSVSRGIEPEIDLIGPPRDPGVWARITITYG